MQPPLPRLLAASVLASAASAGIASADTALEGLPAEAPAGELEVVHLFHDAMPTGVAVSREGRIFVNFPRWGDEPAQTVGEIVDGEVVPYPSAAMNVGGEDAADTPPSDHLVSVQSVVIDPDNRLWILDTGSPRFGGVIPGGAKLIGVDLADDEIFQVVTFPDDVVLKSTYLNDVRFDLTVGEAGFAYITDSSATGENALIVVDLSDGSSRRVLGGHPSVEEAPNFVPIVEGRTLMQDTKNKSPEPLPIGADGIALSAGGETLYWTQLAGRHLFRIPTAALRDEGLTADELAEKVEDLGDRGYASDGLESDAAGNLYLTNYEDGAVMRRNADWSTEPLVVSPHLLWPDTLAVAADGYLYVTSNQLHRSPDYQDGEDRRVKPYALFRTLIDAEPIELGSEDR